MLPKDVCLLGWASPGRADSSNLGSCPCLVLPVGSPRASGGGCSRSGLAQALVTPVGIPFVQPLPPGCTPECYIHKIPAQGKRLISNPEPPVFSESSMSLNLFYKSGKNGSISSCSHRGCHWFCSACAALALSLLLFHRTFFLVSLAATLDL